MTKNIYIILILCFQISFGFYGLVSADSVNVIDTSSDPANADKNKLKIEYRESLKKAAGYFKNKEYQKVILEYQGLLKMYPPGSVEFRYLKYSTAIMYEWLKDNKQAIKEYEDILDSSPEKKEDIFNALEGLARNYSILGERDKAKEYELQIIENYPDSKIAEKLLPSSVDYYLRNKNYSKAIELAEEWLKKVKDTRNYQEISSILIRAYSKKGDFDKALDVCDRIMRKYMYSRLILREFYCHKAAIYAKMGDFNKAHEYYDAVIKNLNDVKPASIQAYSGKGYTYCLTKEYEKAIEEFQKILLGNTFSCNWKASAQFSIARVYEDMKNYDQANKEYEKCLDIARECLDIVPGSKEIIKIALKGIINNYGRLNQEDKTIEYHNRMIAEFPEDKEAENSALQLVGYYWINKDYSKTVELCNEWIVKAKEETTLRRFMFALVTIHTEQGNYEKALELTDEWIKQYKNNKLMLRTLLTFKAPVYINLKDYDKAAELYDKVINEFDEVKPPVSRGIYLARVNVYLKKKDYDRALEFCDDILKKVSNQENSEDANVKYLILELFFKKADIYSEIEKYNKALECYDEVEKKFSFDKWILVRNDFNRAEMYSKKEDYQKSLESYEKLSDSFPKGSLDPGSETKIDEKIKELKEKLKK